MRALQRGFTLVELIIVMVVMGVLAGILVVFFTPAVNNYFATSRRAALTDMADGAMRKISRDVRVSVPNSVRPSSIDLADQARISGNQCIEMVPTSDGGRFRTAPDINNAQSMPVQSGQMFTEFDVLTNTRALPNDWIVIGNQNPDDVYNNVNRAQVAQVNAVPAANLGVSRIKLTGAGMQAPPGYDGARFVVVPAAQGPISYYCRDAGVDASGSGLGTLFRASAYGFGSGGICQTNTANTAVVATRISACSFNYNPNPGATQESGYLEVDITIQEANEPVRLRFGIHVDNIP